MSRPEILVTDLGFTEGPVACADGSLVVTSVDRGLLYRVRADEGRATVLARTRGGPNGATPATGGSLVIAQNGGFDFSAIPDHPDPVAPDRVTPGIQAVHPDGLIDDVDRTGWQAPNDLAADADGHLYVTDPPAYPPAPGSTGRLWRVDRRGARVAWGGPFEFCNGVAVDADGSVAVVEVRGIVRIRPDGEREPVVDDLGEGGADGLCFDTDGRMYVAATTAHGVRVVEDGEEVDFLPIAGPGMTTNCCFGGPENRTLFATDGLPGTVVAWESMPTPGLPVRPWQPDPDTIPRTDDSGRPS